ncbi:short-chain dehydrogenase [Mangrovactinospora gilvigrisea]|uniref:Short-chain dehydrogenase n=1 Tax=Mangrovactinospora gilvigrisea TaxID=1428644 RepID=A0A1J7C280_9ACTN|nr:SDR family oxidoreductase [Mangrovactinospora gilvigrisea]OIV35684.1 short-chain dehydrogenase [Mangrovactinospora gilvigrisea]
MSESVVIVGGTSGIGLSAARRQLAEGRRVVITGRSAERLEAALLELKGAPGGDGAGMLEGRVADAADGEGMRALFAELGSVDHVVIAATGASAAGPFRDITEAELRKAVEGKLIAQAIAAQAALTVLREGGSITFVTAASSGAAMPGTAGLAAVNGAVDSMVPVLAVELAPVRVNAVSPGIVRTPWWNWASEEARRETFDNWAKSAPVGRVGEPEDLGDAIAYLIGNGFTTGTVLRVDGGARLASGA